jgi:hypothetical protein
MQNEVFSDELLLLVVRFLESQNVSSVAAVVAELEQRGTWTRPLWNGDMRALSVSEAEAFQQRRLDSIPVLVARALASVGHPVMKAPCVPVADSVMTAGYIFAFPLFFFFRFLFVF